MEHAVADGFQHFVDLFGDAIQFMLKLTPIGHCLALQSISFFLVFRDECGQHGWVQQLRLEPVENAGFNFFAFDERTVAARPFVARDWGIKLRSDNRRNDL